MSRLHFYIFTFAILCAFCPLGGSANQDNTHSIAFELNAKSAIEKRSSLPRYNLLKNALSKASILSSKEAWFSHLHELKAAHQYRISGSHSYEQYDVWLDAQSGETLGIRPAFKRASASAKVFDYAPRPRLPLSPQLVDRELEDLLSTTRGAPLIGQYFATANCCRFVKCPTGGLVCNPSEWLCAEETDHGATASTKSFRTLRSKLGVKNQENKEDTIYIESSVCTRLPKARVSLDEGGQAVFLTFPIDGDSGEAEGDTFAETQVYYAATEYFKYLRRLMSDETFCFRSRAMSCLPDGEALHIFVNQMLPMIGFDSLVQQLDAGKGAENNPVKVAEMARVTNAAYVTGIGRDANTVERSLEETLGEFIKPYDYLIFFQGNVDLAYDGDVVFHELTHALTTTLLPNLSANNINEKGLYADAGAMDEGYADYFAASFTNSSQIGEYAAVGSGGRAALRDANNLRVCPQDIIGEVHEDSNLWSGALWDIRNWVQQKLGDEHIIQIDRLFLKALSESSNSENFTDQSQRILDLLAASPLLKDGYSVAEDAFFTRGLKACERIYSLNEVMDDTTVVNNPKSALFLMSPENFGLSNFAPPPMQFKITLPKGISNFQIIYEQALSDDSLINPGDDSDGTTLTPLAFVVSPDQPLTWEFARGLATARSRNGPIQVDMENSRAALVDGKWVFATQLTGDASKPRDVYVSMLSTDYDYIVRRIHVEFNESNSSSLSDTSGCGCSATTPKPFSPFEGALLLVCSLLFFASRIKET